MIIHDSNSGHGAIYWDDWLSGQTALGNVIENVGRALLIHGGVCNTFSDNIVINAGWGVQIRGKLRKKVINGTTYNMWDEINGAYNAYANTFSDILLVYPKATAQYPELHGSQQHGRRRSGMF